MARDNELITFLGFSLSPDSLHHVETYTKMVASAQRAVLQFAGVVAGIQLTRYFGAQMNAMKNAAEMTGVSTERLQEWQYAAAKVGVATDAVVNDFKKLTATMASPIPGQFNKNLAMMGVSVYKAKGGLKTADELFGSIADKMSKMSVQRSMQWGKLIGISPETVLLLRQGREALEAYREESRLAIVSDASLDAMARFHREINTLALITKKWSVEFMAAVSNPLLKMVKNIKEWFKLNDEFLRGTQLNATKQLMWAYSDLTKELQALINTFGFLGPAMDKAGKFVKNSLDEGGFSDLVVLFTMFAGGKLFGRLGGKLIGGRLGKAREMRKFVRSYDALPASEQAFVKAPTKKMRKEAAYATKFDFTNSNLLKIAMLGTSFLIGGGKFLAILATAALALDLLQAIVTDNKTVFGELYKEIDKTEAGHKILTAAAEGLKRVLEDLTKLGGLLVSSLKYIVPIIEWIGQKLARITTGVFSWPGDRYDPHKEVTLGEKLWEDWKKTPFFWLNPSTLPRWAMYKALAGTEGLTNLYAKRNDDLTKYSWYELPENEATEEFDAVEKAREDFYTSIKKSLNIPDFSFSDFLKTYFQNMLKQSVFNNSSYLEVVETDRVQEMLRSINSGINQDTITIPQNKGTNESEKPPVPESKPVSSAPNIIFNLWGPIDETTLAAAQQAAEYLSESMTS